MTNDARNRLRNMGGIMASSPELMEVAQRFQAGGPAAPQPPMAGRAPLPPRPSPGPMSLNRALGSPTRPMAPPSAGLPPAVMPFEESVDVDDLLKTTRPPTGGTEDARAARGFGRSAYRSGLDGPVVNLPEDTSLVRPENSVFDLSLEEVKEEKKRLEESQPAPGVFGSSEEKRKFNILTEQEKKLRKETEETIAAEDIAMDQPLVPRELDQATIDKALAAVRDDPNIPFDPGKGGAEGGPDPAGGGADGDPDPGGGGSDTGGPPPKRTKKDLRSRYNEKLELFKEVYGTDDKDEAQDRAMSLAMIGLAIAAGQSPNALTNIAQGALVGLQGMGARREADRERERGVKTLALETAIGQQEAEAAAEAEAAKMDLEQENKLELEREKARLRPSGGSGLLNSEPASRRYTNAYQSVMDQINAGSLTPPKGVTPEEFARSRAVPLALDALSLDVAQGIITDPDQIEAIESKLRGFGSGPSTTSGSSDFDPALQAKVQEDLKTKTPAQVRAGLEKVGKDPSLYGL